MGLGNGNPKQGDRGSNHNFEHRHLLLLGELLTAITGGTPPPAGLATEATLQTVATESTLQTIASTLAQMLAEDQLDFELKAVQDANGDTFQLRGVLDEATNAYVWDYIDSSGAVATPVAPIEFVNLSGLLAAIEGELTTLNAKDFATQTTLAALEAKLNTLGQKASAASAPVVLSTEQEAILTAIQTAVQSIDSGDLATETTLAAIETLVTSTNALLTTIDADTSNLDVALSTVATEVTLSATNALLTTIDGVLDAIKVDTGALVVDLAAIEVLITTTNSLLTTIDGVLDTIKTDTGNILLDTTAIKNAVELIDNTVGTDGSAHGVSQEGVRALGTDGTNDQQIATDSDGHLQVDIVSGGGTVGAALEATQLLVEDHVGNIETEALDQGLTLDAIETEVLDQGTTLDAILVDTGQIETELLDQGTTLDALETEVLDQGTTLDSILTELQALNADDAQNEVATALTSSSTTGAGTIPAGAKAASIFIDGPGGSINSVVRPDGWSQTFEFNNDTLPAIPYDGNGTATIYVDYLV